MNILFTNAGRRTYIIDFVYELINIGYDLNVFVCDVNCDTASMYAHPDIEFFLTPRVDENEDAYYHKLINECIARKIEIVVPLMDFELPILAKNRCFFEKKGIKIWVSDFNTIMRCIDKKQNYFYCKQNGIPIPDSFFNKDYFKYPVVKKKIFGSGSVGLEYFKNEPSFIDFKENEDMLQEFIEGKEYGMDVFNDYNGNFVHCCFREKILMRGGETDKAITFVDQKLEKWAFEISKLFRHRGNMDVDFIQTKSGEFFFIDFNPRFGGGYPFTHLSGSNYLKFIIDSFSCKTPEKPTFKNSITGLKGIKIFSYATK